MPSSSHRETVVVERVHDGDTLSLADGRKVRLIGINTPEINQKGTYGAAWAEAARQKARRFIDRETTVTLVTDKQQYDKYGRVLGHIYNAAGQNLEALLLAEGLGWHVVVPPNLSLAPCLATVEQQALLKDSGVWQQQPVAATTIARGGFQRIVGRVEKVTFASAWWIDLAGNISAVVYSENQEYFDRDALRSLVGKEIELQGWVYPSHSKKYKPWRIKLETPFGFDSLRN